MRSLSLRLAALLVATAVTANAAEPKYKYKTINCEKKYPSVNEPVKEVPEWTALYDLTGIDETSDLTGDHYNYDTEKGDVKKCNENGQWAFTYEGVPSPYTPDVLKALDEAGGVKAAFFVMGSHICDHANNLVDTLNAGHEVAIQSWSPTPFVKLTNGQIIAEIKWTEKAIKKITGLKPKFIRPPEGRIDDRVRAVIKAMGYTPVMYNLDTDDWKYTEKSGFSKKSAIERILDNIPAAGEPGIISLQHDLDAHTVAAARPVIEKVKKFGWEIVPLTKCMGADSFVEGATIVAGKPHGKVTPQVVEEASPAPVPMPKQENKETPVTVPSKNDNEKVNVKESNGSSMFVSLRGTMTVAAGLIFFALAV